MAIPLAPIAGLALRYGVVAVATYAATRAMTPGRLDQPVEDAMDDLPEGLTLRRDREQANATGRMVRVFRFGPHGPGIRVDATALGRVKVTRL